MFTIATSISQPKLKKLASYITAPVLKTLLEEIRLQGGVDFSFSTIGDCTQLNSLDSFCYERRLYYRLKSDTVVQKRILTAKVYFKKEYFAVYLDINPIDTLVLKYVGLEKDLNPPNNFFDKIFKKYQSSELKAFNALKSLIVETKSGPFLNEYSRKVITDAIAP